MGKMAYKLEVSNGQLLLEGKERVIIIPAKMIEKMHEEFYKILGIGAKVALREVGKCLGISVTEIIESELGGKEKNAENLINAITSYLEKTGFGKVEVKKEGNKFVINIKGAPSSTLPENCNYDVNAIGCYFEEGVIMGILEELMGKKVKSAKISAKNGECEVTVEF